MTIIVVSVIVEGSRVSPDLRGNASARWSIINSGIFQAIGVISFAFVCHHNSLLIYGSLETPTLDRFAAVTHVSTLLSLVACCTLAISGFMVFTDKTQGNILNNFPQDDTLINVARFCFGMNMFTTLPLELFVCREVSLS
jgi:sodium-coupled neutral amino acid transporter 11